MLNNRFVFLGLIVLSISGCAGAPVSKHRIQALYGMVYDRDNKPVHNAAIYVNGVYRASSDSQGHFAISQLRPKAKYHITAKREHYETLDLEIAYMESAHVLYLNMPSGDQLIAEAEQAIQNKHWQDAETLLKRAAEVEGGESPPIQFLEAVLAFHRGQYAAALTILKDIALREKEAPHLYLFMADLYQYHLGDPQGARENLNRYLELRYDRIVQSRLEELSPWS
jgi:predicted Zn-dependent protease